jgi:hypothetical protein
MAGIIWIVIWLASIAALVWAVLEHLKCTYRIATALERQVGMESPAPPNILAPR